MYVYRRFSRVVRGLSLILRMCPRHIIVCVYCNICTQLLYYMYKTAQSTEMTTAIQWKAPRKRNLLHERGSRRSLSAIKLASAIPGRGERLQLSTIECYSYLAVFRAIPLLRQRGSPSSRVRIETSVGLTRRRVYMYDGKCQIAKAK